MAEALMQIRDTYLSDTRSGVPNHILRTPVFAQAHISGMPQVAVRRPLNEFELRY